MPSAPLEEERLRHSCETTTVVESESSRNRRQPISRPAEPEERSAVSSRLVLEPLGRFATGLRLSRRHGSSRLKFEPLTNSNPTMNVRSAADKSLALERVQSINGRFVRGDLAAVLDFADEGGTAVLSDISLNILQHNFLFSCKLDHGRCRLFEEE